MVFLRPTTRKVLTKRVSLHVQHLIARLLAIVVMLLAISESMAQQTTAPTIPGTVNCGVQSVLALTKLRNHAVPVEQQAQLIQAYPQTAVSMADVKRIAHSLVL